MGYCRPTVDKSGAHLTGSRKTSTVLLLCALVFLLATASALRAATDNSEEDNQPAREEKPYELPGITVKAGDHPVEQGERSRLEGLPPRNLMERPLTESPGLDTATSVVGEEQIDWMDSYSIVDALKYVPGAWTESRGRKVKEFISVRGQAYPYPGYLIDGAWFREFHETNFFLNAANADRLEVLRSSSSMMLSPGGMTGMVNIVPKTYKEQQTDFETRYGSYNTSNTHINHGGVVDGTSYALGAGYHHTDGPSGENAAENMSNLFGRVVHPVNEYLSLSLTSFYLHGDRELQLAEPPASTRFQTRYDSFDPMNTYLAVGKAHYTPSPHATTDVILNYGKRRFDGHRRGSPDWVEEDYEFGGRVTQALELSETNVLRFGGLYNHWKSPTGKRFYVGNPADQETYSAMMSDEQKVGPLTLNAAYRWTRTYTHEFGGFNVEGSPRGIRSVQVTNEWEDPLQTVNFGGSYALTDLTSLHGNVQYGEIAARPGLLNANLEQPGDETRVKYDLGIKRSWDSFGEIDLTVFYVDQTDAPLATRNQVIVDGDPFVLYENADRENYGIELDTRTRRFENGLQAFFNAVAMTSERTMNGQWEDDPETPDVILGGGASYLLMENLDLSAWLKHVGPYMNQRFRPMGADRVGLGNFTELNTKLSYYFGDEKQHEAFFAIDNLTDREYSTVVGWPNEGITYRVGLGLTW